MFDLHQAMGKPTAAEQKKTGASRHGADADFAVPSKGKFPLKTAAQVRNAASRVHQAASTKNLTPVEKQTVERKVASRERELGIGKGKKK